MKLFDLTFGKHDGGAEELFVRGAAAGIDGTVCLDDGQCADFGTYFNLLSYGTYAKYCGAKKFTLDISAEGKYRADIFIKHRSGADELILSRVFDGDAHIDSDLPGAKAGGYAYFTVTSLGGCTIRGGSWSADMPQRRQAKIAIVICTYKREQFVCANLGRIESAVKSRPEWAERLHVFVVDNARTLNLEKSGIYTVIPNGNSGGSGGFTRGICEATKDPSFTHFLLMDDDIRFEFSVLERTYRLLCALEKEHENATVGGAMLVLEDPCVQYEFGGIYNGLNFRLINSGLDMRRPSSLLRNESAEKPDYNAWWFCCMPSSTPEKHGLPMPFFIKGDDVEYGMRAAEEIILTSGIAVWHQDFAGKYTGVLEYYIKRNMAVVSALHSKGGGLKAAVRFAYFIFKNLIIKNYDCAEVLYLAYKDFMRGPEFFLTAAPEKVNDEIRKYSKAFSSAGEIEALFGGRPHPKKRSKSKKSEFFRCLFLSLENYMPAFMLSDKIAVTDAGNPSAADCFMKKTAVQFDEASGKGLVLKFDGARRRKLRRAAYRVFFGMIFKYGAAKRKYLAKFKEMTSLESWTEIFEGRRTRGRE